MHFIFIIFLAMLVLATVGAMIWVLVNRIRDARHRWVGAAGAGAAVAAEAAAGAGAAPGLSDQKMIMGQTPIVNESNTDPSETILKPIPQTESIENNGIKNGKESI